MGAGKPQERLSTPERLRITRGALLCMHRRCMDAHLTCRADGHSRRRDPLQALSALASDATLRSGLAGSSAHACTRSCETVPLHYNASSALPPWPCEWTIFTRCVMASDRADEIPTEQAQHFRSGIASTTPQRHPTILPSRAIS